MKSIKEHIEGFAYPFLEHILENIDREWEETPLGGFKCKMDEGNFSLGTLIKCSVTLYLKGKSTEKSNLFKERLLRLFDRINEDTHFSTWGKKFLLEALVILKNADEMHILSDEKITLLKKLTDYGDFFDKEKVEIPKDSVLPTNYYHVALTCAVQRELLGFENDGMSKKIGEKLLGIMKANSGGWMDEVPPRGRFDSYSLSAYSHTYTSLCEIGMKDEVPSFITENIKESALICLSMKNRAGHGFGYGRSLSVYGDLGNLSKTVFCIKNDLVSGKEKDDAIAYCINICERLINFWFRKEENFFDIWTRSRATDCYRGTEVVLNLNLEITLGLISTLESFKEMGLENYIPKENVSLPDKWETRKTVFVDEKEKKRALYVLRRGDHTFSLPFVGMSSKSSLVNDAYFAFPHEAEFIEEPVWQYQPFLVPEILTKDGTIAILMEDFRSIEDEYGDDKITISAIGKLVARDTTSTNIGFTAKYIFDGAKIKVEFNIDEPYESARMLFSGAKTDHVRFIGAVSEEVSDVWDKKEFKSCCGGIKECKTAFFKDKIGYEITL